MHQKPHSFKKTLDHVDDDETLLAKIHRHPFGIFLLYAQVGFGLVAAAGLLIYILPGIIDREENPEVYGFIGLGFLVIAAFLVMIMIVSTILYRQSQLIVTDKTITQVIQEGLFNRKLSQLGVANIEDVTANKRGFFQTMINYGVLTIETAGEQQNFYFYYCPNPNYYAKLILEAREDFMAKQHAAAPAQHYYYGPPPPSDQTTQQYYAQPQQMPPAPYQPYPPQQAQAPQAPEPPANTQLPTPGTDYPGPAQR